MKKLLVILGVVCLTQSDVFAYNFNQYGPPGCADNQRYLEFKVKTCNVAEDFYKACLVVASYFAAPSFGGSYSACIPAAALAFVECEGMKFARQTEHDCIKKWDELFARNAAAAERRAVETEKTTNEVDEHLKKYEALVHVMKSAPTQFLQKMEEDLPSSQRTFEDDAIINSMYGDYISQSQKFQANEIRKLNQYYATNFEAISKARYNLKPWEDFMLDCYYMWMDPGFKSGPLGGEHIDCWVRACYTKTYFPAKFSGFNCGWNIDQL